MHSDDSTKNLEKNTNHLHRMNWLHFKLLINFANFAVYSKLNSKFFFLYLKHQHNV